MKKLLLLIVLVPLVLGRCNCKEEENENEYIADDDETCSKGMSSWFDSTAGFFQRTLESILTPTGKEMETTFLSFSCQNEQEPYYVTNTNFSSWGGKGFAPGIKSTFIIHGYKDRQAEWTRELKDALLLRESCNVFIVEYGHPSETWSHAFENVPEIGKQVATFIRNLMKTTGLDLAKVHIIGHSAGAQSAGFAGKEIKRTESKPLGRITGLDPAGPGFYDAEPDQRLDARDASFVDVIHTNKGCNRLGGLGYPGAIGHFDFYPNGGELQPGCLQPTRLFSKKDIGLRNAMFHYLFGVIKETEIQILKHTFCNHVRSYVFFTASLLIKGCKFKSIQCSSWNRYLSGQCDGNNKVVMGYYADRYKDFVEEGMHKKFYLNTSSNSPYCIKYE